MRMVFFIGALACSVCSAAIAQTCETMTIRDGSGQIISNSMMCVDADGAWADPASLSATQTTSESWETPAVEAPIVAVQQPVVLSPLPVAAPAPQIIDQPAALPPMPTPAPLAPVVTVQQPALLSPLPIASPAPQITSDPVVAYSPIPAPAPQAPLIETSESELLSPLPLASAQPVIYSDPAPQAVTLTPSRAAENWQPTSGAAKRRALYAELGLVCNARKAKFCSDSSPCAGRCEGRQGWCDGKTGEVHASLEQIERLNCRKKKR